MLIQEPKPGNTIIINGKTAIVKKFKTHYSQTNKPLYHSIELKPNSYEC